MKCLWIFFHKWESWTNTIAYNIDKYTGFASKGIAIQERMCKKCGKRQRRHA